MDYHQKENYHYSEYKFSGASMYLFGLIGAVLYTFITHDLMASAGSIWILGFLITFGLSATFGYFVRKYFIKRRLNKESENEHDQDSGSDR